MKLKGHKIGNMVYFVSQSAIDEHGSLENAAQAAKARRDAKDAPQVAPSKPKKTVKAESDVVQQIEEIVAETPTV